MISLRNIGLIPLSLLVALFLNFLPLPTWANPYRPDWLMMCVIAWGILLPRVMGVVLPWMIGVVVDAMMGSIIGAHALAYATAAYFTHAEHQRLKVNPLGQQMLFILLLLLSKQLVLLLINGALGYQPEDILTYFAPSLTGMLLWPVCYQFILSLSLRHNMHQNR